MNGFKKVFLFLKVILDIAMFREGPYFQLDPLNHLNGNYNI